MSKSSPTNVASSVHQRLLNEAKKTNRPFNELLQYYAMERFLYRLSRSPHAKRFVLKGALMFAVWKASHGRPTMDIDLLGRMENSPEIIVSTFRSVCEMSVESDGLLFDAGSVEAEPIAEDADYEGVRVRVRGMLGNARLTVQVDIGFADVVFPKPSQVEYPTILDMPAPKLQGYGRESAIAEKFEAMVKLGILNSRMKDFYDIWLLSRQFDFDGKVLAKAIEGTFANRKTDLMPNPVAFTPAFSQDHMKQTQWQAFVRKSRLADAPTNLANAIESIATFLGPITAAFSSGQPFRRQWKAPGPWA